MPRPANVLTTTSPGVYEDSLREHLLAEAGARGLDLGPGYHSKPDLVAALVADDEAKAAGEPASNAPVEPGADLGAAAEFIPPDQPAHRQDANQPSAPVVAGDVVVVARTHLQRMSRGEVVEVGGVRLAADPADFPPYWKLA